MLRLAAQPLDEGSLPLATTPAQLADPAAPLPLRLPVEPPRLIDGASRSAQLAGRLGGCHLPSIYTGGGGLWVGNVELVALAAAQLLPGSGLVVTAAGAPCAATLAELTGCRPGLRRVAGITERRGDAWLRVVATTPTLERGAVWLPAGGGNWGHFLLDALSSLDLIEQSGLRPAEG